MLGSDVDLVSFKWMCWDYHVFSRDEIVALDVWKTRWDRIRNDNIRERVGVEPTVENMVETRLGGLGM